MADELSSEFVSVARQPDTSDSGDVFRESTHRTPVIEYGRGIGRPLLSFNNSTEGYWMSDPDPLDIEYSNHTSVQDLIDTIEFCAETIGLEFDRWDEPHVHGPGLYFAVVSGSSVRGYADVTGENQWPIEDTDDVLEDVFTFYEAAKRVSQSRDGAVVVGVDGSILPQMVRFRTPPDRRANAEYAEWMGTRHMSALDTSSRPEVVTTITLSAENGRVTTFREGDFTTRLRDDLSQKW